MTLCDTVAKKVSRIIEMAFYFVNYNCKQNFDDVTEGRIVFKCLIRSTIYRTKSDLIVKLYGASLQ